MLDFAYDASGNPFSLTYNGTKYYYVTNLQGDVFYLVDTNGSTAATYTYDPYGKVLTATGDIAEINPLRYRGYYYDTDSGFYYLQSRYYDPAICRFINADVYASTGQGFVGNNMFAYCQNNSANYSDYTGHRIVGFGLQVKVQVGGVDIGFEIVIYFDPEVCDGDDFVIVFYNYSGTELTLTEVEDLLKVIDYGLLTALVSERDEIELDAILGMARMLLENVGVSGGAFVIDGNEKFKDPTNYSGPFQTVSFSGRLKNCVGTAFYSYSDSCTTVGAKVGVTTSRFAFTPRLSQHFIDWLPFSCTYSQSNYSEPIVLYRG